MKNHALPITLVKLVLLCLGLFFMAFGVSLSVKADLGVSPISCVPYVYSLASPLSLGEVTIAMNGLFIVLQIALLRKKYQLSQLSQAIAVFFLGYCIDFTFQLLANFNPTTYTWKAVALLLSCALIALGIFLFVQAESTYIPGDALVLVIAQIYKKEFGKVKICFDSTMVAIGAVSSLLFLHKLVGIREGTILAALLVGLFMQWYAWLIRTVLPLCRRQHSTPHAPASSRLPISSPSSPGHRILTISREYGSGGHEIGQVIAHKLGIAFYDKELISKTAEQSGFTTEYIRENEQKINNRLFHELYAQHYAVLTEQRPPIDTLFLIQSKIIRDISSTKSCVIVGRCSNFVLQDHPACFNVFIHANNTFRRNKINQEYQEAEIYSDRELKQFDQQRANYYQKYTGRDWRDCRNYHATIDRSSLTTDQVADICISMLPPPSS